MEKHARTVKKWVKEEESKFRPRFKNIGGAINDQPSQLDTESKNGGDGFESPYQNKEGKVDHEN